jgi:hypothetical protein
MSGPKDKFKPSDGRAGDAARQRKREQARKIAEQRRQKEQRERERRNLGDRLGNTRSHSADDFIKEIDGDPARPDKPSLREKYGIPKPRPGKRYGGWVIREKGTGKPLRRMDFYFSIKEGSGGGTEKPVVYRMLQKESRRTSGGRTETRTEHPLSDNAASAAEQLKRLEGTKWGADVALTLVITQRESTRAGFGSSDRRINSYYQGGLDSLYRWQRGLKRGGYLPADFPTLEKAPGRVWNGRDYNEVGISKAKRQEKLLHRVAGGERLEDACKALKLRPGSIDLPRLKQRYEDGGRRWEALLDPRHEVFPARLPQNRAIEAYGAVLNQRHQSFLGAAERAGFSADDLGSLSKDARRVWNTVFFIRPTQGIGLLNRYHKQDRDLNFVMTDAKAKRLHGVRRALINAAEAELLERKLNLPYWGAGK